MVAAFGDEMATLAIEPTPTFNLEKPLLVADADDSRYSARYMVANQCGDGCHRLALCAAADYRLASGLTRFRF